MKPDADVPCNGCTACCQHDLIMLQPGEDPAAYDTAEATNPLTGETGRALRHKPEGGCIYVTEAGCAVHDRAPMVCRVFDCRVLYRDLMRLPRVRRRQVLKQARTAGLASNAVLRAGRDRLSSMEASHGR